MIALDGDRLGDGDGAAIAVELRELGLHGMAQPQRAGSRGQGHEDQQHDADAQQPEEPAAVASQDGLSLDA